MNVFDLTSRPGSDSSSSDEVDGEMTFITEFGGEESTNSSRPMAYQGSSYSSERHRGERTSDYNKHRSSSSRRQSRSRSRLDIELYEIAYIMQCVLLEKEVAATEVEAEIDPTGGRLLLALQSMIHNNYSIQEIFYGARLP